MKNLLIALAVLALVAGTAGACLAIYNKGDAAGATRCQGEHATAQAQASQAAIKTILEGQKNLDQLLQAIDSAVPDDDGPVPPVVVHTVDGMRSRHGGDQGR